MFVCSISDLFQKSYRDNTLLLLLTTCESYIFPYFDCWSFFLFYIHLTHFASQFDFSNSKNSFFKKKKYLSMKWVKIKPNICVGSKCMPVKMPLPSKTTPSSTMIGAHFWNQSFQILFKLILKITKKINEIS